jgi:rubrerythrin
MAPTAREQGFPDMAEWFETRAKAEKTMLVGSSAGSNPSRSRDNPRRFPCDMSASPARWNNF